MAFEIRQTATKGMGMFAVSSFNVGNLILEEAPFFKAPRVEGRATWIDIHASMHDVYKEYLLLSESDRKLFNSLHESTKNTHTLWEVAKAQSSNESEKRGALLKKMSQV